MAEKERKIQPTAVPLDTLPEPCTVKTSRDAMFVDDTKIYKQVKSQEDAAYLQPDLLAG